MSKLPLKVQVGIRDAWDSKEAPVQKAMATLRSSIGVDVTVNPEWPLLHTELGSFYPDKGIFPASVAAAVESCCEALVTLADDEANAEWADMLLERSNNHIKLFIEVSKQREPNMTWAEPQRGFVIALPKSAVPSRSYMLSFFSGRLLKIFDDDTKQHIDSTSSSSSPFDDKTDADADAVDDWADVVVHTGRSGVAPSTQEYSHHRNATSSYQQQQQQKETPAFEVLPDVTTTARPDDLLLKPPYHLILRGIGSSNAHVEVECSHSPTLQFLCEYLKKWARTNHNITTRPPFAEITLHQSAFGLGVVYDRLTVASESRYNVQSISPTVVLALVEGVLGYKSVSSEAGAWTFRRDVEFKGGRYY